MEKEFEKYGVSSPILVYLQWLYTLKTKNVYFVCLFVKKKKKALSLIQFCVFSFLPCLPSSLFAVNLQVRQKSFF